MGTPARGSERVRARPLVLLIAALALAFAALTSHSVVEESAEPVVSASSAVVELDSSPGADLTGGGCAFAVVCCAVLILLMRRLAPTQRRPDGAITARAVPPQPVLKVARHRPEPSTILLSISRT